MLVVQVNDTFLFSISVLAIGPLLGMYVLNFPLVRYFLRWGAYFCGAFLIFLAIMLSERNETISPFAILLIVLTRRMSF